MQNDFNTTEDFLADESFVSWVLQTDESSGAQWDSWIGANPAKLELVQQAITMLQQIRINENVVSPTQQASAETRLLQTIQNEKADKAGKLISINRRKWWYSAAAAAVLAGMVWYSISFNDNKIPTPQLATTYGQVQQDKLPDGTEVILNANSNISYQPNWKEGADREVWIKGEAFFHVKKTAHRDKFTVHTDGFDIEVTGTSFNVVNRNNISSIILKEGSVKIHRKGEADINMVPGDVVEFNNKQIQKKTTQKTDYLAWTESKLVFDSTPIAAAAASIKEIYGVEVVLKGNGITDKTITGILPNNNLAVLLQALEGTQDFEIKQTGNTITISNKN